MSLRNWFGLKCAGQMCGGTVESDATGIWWRCAECGQRSGHSPRAEVDAMIDRDLAAFQRRRARQQETPDA